MSASLKAGQNQHTTIAITSEADRPGLEQVLRNPRVRGSIHWLSHPFTMQDVDSWLDRAAQGAKSGKEYLFSLHADDIYVGSVNIHRQGDASAELGYWIDPEHWNKGYAAEAVRLAVAFVRDSTDIAELVATTAQDNGPSQRVLEKNGFIYRQDIVIETAAARRASKLFALDLRAAALI